jgi:uncharacterized protein YndB with AHSA1/START domain
MSDDGRFELEIEVVGTPEQVWNAIATGEGVSAWLQPTEIEEHPGGRFAYDLDGRGGWNETGAVSGYDPPHRFSTTGVHWRRSDRPDDVVTLATEWIVEPRDGGTCVVRMVMSGFDTSPDWDAEVGGVRDGMVSALRSLQHHLATTTNT